LPPEPVVAPMAAPPAPVVGDPPVVVAPAPVESLPPTPVDVVAFPEVLDGFPEAPPIAVWLEPPRPWSPEDENGSLHAANAASPIASSVAPGKRSAFVVKATERLDIEFVSASRRTCRSAFSGAYAHPFPLNKGYDCHSPNTRRVLGDRAC